MKIYTVSEFNQAIKSYLAEGLPRVAVQGEVSGFRVAREKLVYFELKDKSSRVLCFTMKWELTVPLEDGMEVKVIAGPSLFVQSGGFHLRVITVEPVGEGALKRALELLMKKLETEGLFAPEHKQPLPRFPAVIGLVTSPDAAARTDVLRILKNRWAGFQVKFAPTAVQGTGAAKQIVAALQMLSRDQAVEVIILTRGGGSLEDLQAFNSEEVARAIFASRAPVVVGVGHERDVTVADSVADARASTPSNAAELVVPDRREILFQLETFERHLVASIESAIEAERASVDQFVVRLEEGLSTRTKKFDLVADRLQRSFLLIRQRLASRHDRLTGLAVQLGVSAAHRLERLRLRLAGFEQSLKNLNPENVLGRGYSITFAANGRPVADAANLSVGETITSRFHRGMVHSRVEKKQE